jgi:hypothetical protein
MKNNTRAAATAAMVQNEIGTKRKRRKIEQSIEEKKYEQQKNSKLEKKRFA